MFTLEAIEQLELIAQSRDIVQVAYAVNKMSLPAPIKTAALFQLSRMGEIEKQQLFLYLDGLIVCLQEDPENGFTNFLRKFEFPSQITGFIHGLVNQQ
jgi:hypothetical protein